MMSLAQKIVQKGLRRPRIAPSLRRVRRSAHWKRLRNGFFPLRWLVRTALWPRRRRVAGIVALSALSSTAAGGAISLMAFFGNLLQGRRLEGLGFLGDRLGNNALTLVLMSGSIFALLLLAAATAYHVSASARAEGRAFQIECLRSVLHAFAAGRIPEAEPTLRGVQRLAVGSARLAGFAVETLLKLAQPLLFLAAAVVLLFVLDARLTLVVLPFALLLAPFLYRVALSLKRSASAYYGDIGEDMRIESSRLVELVDSTSSPGALDEAMIESALGESGTLHRFYDVQDELRLGGNRAALVTSVFRSAFVLFALLLLGYNALRGRLAWGSAIAYVVALGQMMGQLQSLVITSSSLGRFYPDLGRLAEVFEASALVALPAPLPFPDAIRIRAGGDHDPGQREVVLRPGERAAYYQRYPLGRIERALWIAPLEKASDAPPGCWRQARFVSARRRPLGLPLAALLSGEPSAPPAAVAAAKALLARFGLESAAAALPDGLFTRITPELWEQLGDGLRAALRLAPLRGGPPGAVFVEADVLAGVEPRQADRLLELLSAHLVLVCLRRPGLPPVPVSSGLLCEGDEVTAVGDARWLQDAAPRWRPASGPRPTSAAETDLDAYDF